MELKFLQDARYDITEQIYNTLLQNRGDRLDIDSIDNDYDDSGRGKIYFDIEVEDTTLTIELSVSIIDAQETLTLNN